jgi:hypothetical protein
LSEAERHHIQGDHERRLLLRAGHVGQQQGGRRGPQRGSPSGRSRQTRSRQSGGTSRPQGQQGPSAAARGPSREPDGAQPQRERNFRGGRGPPPRQ